MGTEFAGTENDDRPNQMPVSHLQLQSARSCDATAQRQPPLAARTGANLLQTVFDGVQGTFRLCTVLHH